MENLKKTPEQQDGVTKASKLGTKLGEIVGAVLILCATAVVVALTTKFIFWLF